MTRTRLRLAVLTLALVLTLGACGSSGTGATSGSTGTTTGTPATLADVQGKTYSGDALTGGNALKEGTILSLAFEGEHAAANAGCNSIVGNAVITDGVLGGFENAITTSMACPGAAMTQEKWFVDFLASGPTVTLTNEGIILSKNGLTVILDEGGPATEHPDGGSAETTPLVGTTWTLASYSVGTGDSVDVPDGVTSTLVVADVKDGKGQLNLKLGCNTGGASATIEKGSVTVGPIRSTMMACPEPQTTVETAVTTILQGQSDTTLNGTTLVLTSERGVLAYTGS